MTDIVERLRDHDRHIRGRLIEGLTDLVIDDMVEAADEIERLREEKRQMALKYLTAEGQWIEETGRLREALRYYANKTQAEWVNVTGADDGVIARAALGEKE